MTPALAALLAEDVPAPVALLRLIGAAGSAEAALTALAAANASALPPTQRERLMDLRRLADGHAEGLALAAGILRDGPDHRPLPGDSAAAVARFAASFDRAAGRSPEAAAALCSFGDPTLLAALTGEAVAFLAGRGLLAEGRTVLDVGCGAGRLAAALAPRVRRVIGIDVSMAMLAAAPRLPGMLLLRGSGLDLAAIATGAVDLVVALDSFPYLRLAGLAAAHLAEAARVLRPGGDLVVLNYAYDAPPEAAAAELLGHGAAAGLLPLVTGARPFRLWDGAAFHLRKACGTIPAPEMPEGRGG